MKNNSHAILWTGFQLKKGCSGLSKIVQPISRLRRRFFQPRAHSSTVACAMKSEHLGGCSQSVQSGVAPDCSGSSVGQRPPAATMIELVSANCYDPNRS